MPNTEESNLAKLLKIINEKKSDPATLVNEIVDLTSNLDPSTCDAIVNKLKLQKNISEVLKKVYSEYIFNMESREVDLLLNSDTTEKTFGEIAEGGAKMAYNRVGEIFKWLTLKPHTRITMVGCGKLPVTAIHLSEESNVKEIVCLDVVGSSIETAERLIEKMGLKNIKFLHCSGDKYDYQDSDIVYVANMVCPKIDVVKKIIQTTKKRPDLILREPYGLGKLWTEHCEPELGDELSVKAYGPGSRYLSRDVLLTWNI